MGGISLIDVGMLLDHIRVAIDSLFWSEGITMP